MFGSVRSMSEVVLITGTRKTAQTIHLGGVPLSWPMARLARLLQTLETRGGQSCLYCDRRWHTYGELVARIAFWRQHLISLALESGSVIGLEADYSLDSIALLLAVSGRGLDRRTGAARR